SSSAHTKRHATRTRFGGYGGGSGLACRSALTSSSVRTSAASSTSDRAIPAARRSAHRYRRATATLDNAYGNSTARDTSPLLGSPKARPPPCSPGAATLPVSWLCWFSADQRATPSLNTTRCGMPGSAFQETRVPVAVSPPRSSTAELMSAPPARFFYSPIRDARRVGNAL